MTPVSPGQIAVFLQLAATAAACACAARLGSRARIPSWTAAGLGAAAVALVVAGLAVSDPPHAFDDFRSAYYPAGRAVLHSAADLRALTERGVSGFVNMPVVAFAFAPLSLLPLSGAAAVFSLLSLAAVGLTWLLLAETARLDTRGRWLLALLFCANGPLLYSVKEGNTSQFVLLALIAGLALLRSERAVVAGLVLGLATVIKPPLLLFGPFFLLRRDWRASFGFFGVIGLTAALSLAVFGWRDNVLWFDSCILRFSRSWMGAFNVQSIPGFLLRLSAGADILGSWNAYPPPSGLALVAKIATAILFAAAILAGLPRSGSAAAVERRRDLQYLMVICLVLVGSPLSWSHYYCWLLIPAGFFLAWPKAAGASPRVAALGWIAIGLTTPLVRQLMFPSVWMETFYKDAAASHLLFGGLIWFALLAWRLRSADGPLSAGSGLPIKVGGTANISRVA